MAMFSPKVIFFRHIPNTGSGGDIDIKEYSVCVSHNNSFSQYYKCFWSFDPSGLLPFMHHARGFSCAKNPTVLLVLEAQQNTQVSDRDFIVQYSCFI